MTTGRRTGVLILAALLVGPVVAVGQGERRDTVSMDETALVLPTPASLAIWTERQGYLAWRELIRVYLAVDPNGDRRRIFREYVYLENFATGQRRYLAGNKNRLWLRDRIVDLNGRSQRSMDGVRIVPRPPAMIWSGRALEPGLWQFVVELRSNDTTEVVKRAHTKFVVSAKIPRIVGAGGRDTEISTDTTWTNDRVHAIRGQVFVNAGATLTIEPGTLVLARGPAASIVVERAGRIMAKGLPDAPIVMTCDEAVGQRFAGCWGGLVILGGAPVTAGTRPAAGIEPATRSAYGGADPQDSSGILRYVRVEFAGAGSNAERQNGGLSLFGVGSGTVIDHVQVHASAGDGIRFVGGMANCMHCVSSGAEDDGLAWAGGWQGTAQRLYIQLSPSGGDCGIEGGDTVQASGSSSVAPPRLYNVTVVASASGGSIANSRRSGIVLRNGSSVTARNAIISGFESGAIKAMGSSPSMFRAGISSIANSILHANGSVRAGGHIEGMGAEGMQYLDAEPKLVNVRYAANPDPRPRLSSPAIRVGAGVVPPSDGILDTSAQWIGAFGDSNWLEEWTFFGPESDYRSVERIGRD